MPNVAFLPPQSTVSPAPPAGPAPARHTPGGAFWSHGLCLGANVILASIEHVDTHSLSIARLPAPADPARPMVAQYMFMVKTLAAAWTGHSRPALLTACAALRHYGNTFAGHDAALLAAALQQSATGNAEAGGGAARLVDGLIRRLGAPLDGYAAVHQDFGSYLAQMAGASSDLETDTVLVTQRLQADHVHAFILAQHIHALQGKLGEAQERGQGGWLRTAEAEMARKQAATHSAALASVRGQLDQLRAGQEATMAEAAYLQGLLPAVSTYLGGIDRMGVGVHAALSGTLAMQENLAQLKQDLLSGRADCGALHADLQASLPDWRELTGWLAQLPAAARP